MSPQSEWVTVRGWAKKDERLFLEKVQCSDPFWRALRGFSQSSGIEVDDLHGLAEELCRCCWSQADSQMGSEGPLAAARAEAEQLRKKLNQCNLSAMKQMAAAKSGMHCSEQLGNDTITFHEPLQHLDADVKDLVLTIVCDKLRQMESNHAPPSLMAALEQHARALNQPRDEASEEELKELRSELEDVRSQLRAARVRSQEAEDRALAAEHKLQQVRELLAAAEEALAESREREAKLRAERDELLEASKRMRAEIERQQLQIEQQQAELDRRQAELERLARELETEREANAQLRAEVESLQQRLRETLQQVEKLQQELGELQTRFDLLEQEAQEMREELARRNNTKTRGTQTTLTGSKLDEQVAEIKRLKVMLEELQMKLKELMDRYRRKFGQEATEIADDMGLRDLLKEDTVFQRLYDDAIYRVHRLEKLRAKVRKDREEMWPGKSSPRTAAAGSPETSVLAAVEQSELRALRQLVPEEAQATPARRAATAVAGCQHDRACGPDTNMGSRMKTSLSLPALSNNATVSVFNFDLHGKRNRRRSSCKTVGGGTE